MEVLFSVIIIGVGVIMIAGVFPVALQQSQANLGESAAIPMSRDALRDIQSVATNYVPLSTAAGAVNFSFPATYNAATAAVTPYSTFPIMPIPNALTTVGGNSYAYSTLIYNSSNLPPTPTSPFQNFANPAVLGAPGTEICNADRRYGWVAFYRRDLITINGQAMPAPYAQVWIITAHSTTEGQPTFSTAPSIQPQVNLQTGTLAYTAASGSVIQLPIGTTAVPNPAAPNAYALVLSAPGDPALIGQFVRLGTIYGSNTTVTPNVNLWNLLPGSDLNINDTLINNSSTTTITGASPSMVLKGGQAVTVFILGSSFDSTSQLYDGPVQDLTATSGFIRVSN